MDANSFEGTEFGSIWQVYALSAIPASKRNFVFSDRIRLTRRAAFAGLGAVTAAQTLTATTARSQPLMQLKPSCVLTPQAIEGPYYFDPKLERADITEGHPGAPLELAFVVMDAASCQPLGAARVDVWHARADGLYSGYRGQGDDHATDTSGTAFMRGSQTTDGQGRVRFRTVYPGWYEGRTTHIHFKVFVDTRNVLTGQMYFPDALSQYLYGNVGAYRRQRARDTFNADDGIALMDKTRGGFCDIREEADRYVATLVVGVDRAATAKAEFGPPGFPPGPPPGPPPAGRPGRPPRPPAAIVPGVATTDQKG